MISWVLFNGVQSLCFVFGSSETCGLDLNSTPLRLPKSK